MEWQHVHVNDDVQWRKMFLEEKSRVVGQLDWHEVDQGAMFGWFIGQSNFDKWRESRGQSPVALFDIDDSEPRRNFTHVNAHGDDIIFALANFDTPSSQPVDVVLDVSLPDVDANCTQGHEMTVDLAFSDPWFIIVAPSQWTGGACRSFRTSFDPTWRVLIVVPMCLGILVGMIIIVILIEHRCAKATERKYVKRLQNGQYGAIEVEMPWPR